MTKPIHLQPQPDAGCASRNRSGLRVPFGLREGRVWAPREVDPGLACGCICPACHQPLVAKAIASSKRVPHFAHCGEVACETGAETGIHLRAKQVIADRMRVLLPSWGGNLLDKPNPPAGRDNLRRPHEGERIDIPGYESVLREVHPEYVMDGFTPDVHAIDADGELLIEIRYTHAVDEQKAQRVRAGGYRMIEIDLSGMDRDTPHDPDAFERLVLDEPGNRAWISCPAKEAAWAESKRQLDARIDEINRQIEEQALCEQREARQRLETLRQDAKDKKGRRAYMRQQLRTPHLAALAELPGRVAPARVARLTADLEAQATDKLVELRRGLPSALDRVCMAPDEDDWIYGVAPALWRLCLLRHFVRRHNPGDRFNNRDVFQWIKSRFPIDSDLYGLFLAQYRARREAREAGYRKRSLDFWAFTEGENALIPNFYLPVNRFIERLAHLGLLKHVAAELGGYEVASPPEHGMLADAAVAPD
ncbi:hypothetical protein [Luteimonas sp. A478]